MAKTSAFFLPVGMAILLGIIAAPTSAYALSCIEDSRDPAKCQHSLSNEEIAPGGNASNGLRLNGGVRNVFFNTYSGLCRFVDNAGSNHYFIPQNTVAELTAFMNNHPSDVIVGNCLYPTNYTAISLAPASNYQLNADGSVVPLSGTPATIPVAVPVDPTTDPLGGIRRVDINSTFPLDGQPLLLTAKFPYTRQDCRVDAAGTNVCNTYPILETQTISYNAVSNAAPGTDRHWGSPTVTSLFSIVNPDGSLQPPLGTHPNAGYNPPGPQPCTHEGVNYTNGQTWIVKTQTTQTPTVEECPHGAGTRIDNMETETTYMCTDGLANAQGTSAPVLISFTGQCADQEPLVVTDVAATDYSACSIANGVLYCWGSVDSNVWASGDQDPASFSPQNWTSTGAGWSKADAGCGIKDGSLLCWDDYAQQNFPGQTTTRTSLTSVDNSTGWTHFFAGWGTMCGIKNGEAYCRGKNNVGQLGLSDTLDRSEMTQIKGVGSNWTDISGYSTYNCGIESGNLYCWGNNSSGCLARGGCGSVWLNNGGVPSSTSPRQITTPASGWTKISVGNYSYNMCGINNGALYCWGNNSGGQVGVGNTTHYATPQRVGTDNDWTDISIAPRSPWVCGIRAGNLYCWGYQNMDWWYDWSAPTYRTPRQFGHGLLWSKVSAGAGGTCAISSGALYCMGLNNYAQLGRGDRITDYYTMKQVGFPIQAVTPPTN